MITIILKILPLMISGECQWLSIEWTPFACVKAIISKTHANLSKRMHTRKDRSKVSMMMIYDMCVCNRTFVLLYLVWFQINRKRKDMRECLVETQTK